MRIFAGIFDKKGNNAVHNLLQLLTTQPNYHRIFVFHDKIFKTSDYWENKAIEKAKSPIALGLCIRKPGLTKHLSLNSINGNNYVLYGKTYHTDSIKIHWNNLNNLNGSYIIAILKNNSLLVTKDKIGIKQLYYGENSEISGFSTQKESLRNMGIFPKRALPGEKLEFSKKGIKSIGQRTLKKPKLKISTEKSTIKRYKKVLINSIYERVRNNNKIGILFSGGVDSAIIAKILKDLNKDVICYTAGLPKSNDLNHAKEAAKFMDLPIKMIRLNPIKIKHLLPEVIHSIETCNQLQVESALPIFCTMQSASKDGIDMILNGQGADELFAGYDWYSNVLNKEDKEKLMEYMWKDILLGFRETFERQNKIAEYHDLELRVPYCDNRIIEVAMSIPLELKIKRNDLMRKYIHRKMAEEIGVPLLVAWREKESAYESSGVHQNIELIAQHMGYLEDKKYKFQTKFERVGKEYRYGNKYRNNKDKFGDNYIQTFFEDIAINLDIASPTSTNN